MLHSLRDRAFVAVRAIRGTTIVAVTANIVSVACEANMDQVSCQTAARGERQEVAEGSRAKLARPQAKPLQFPRLRPWQRVAELHSARVLVGRDRRLHEVLQRLHHRLVA